jgi:predicted acetyltransferase
MGNQPERPAATPVDVLPLTAADRDRLLAVDLATFFFDPTGIDPGAVMGHFDWSRTFGASRDGGQNLCGIYTSYDMQVTTPGPLGSLSQLPMAGLSWVSVHPDHRRRGVLRTMVGHHLHELHEQGTALSGLHAAEVPIYGRFGYAVASLEVSLNIGRGTTFAAPALDPEAARVETRFTAVDDDAAAALQHELHLRSAALTLGAVTRPDRMSRSLFTDQPAERRDREPGQVMFSYRDGEPTGYARFARRSQWTNGNPNGSVAVAEMAAADTPSLLALARRMVDFDLTSSVTIANRGMDDPLVWWAGGPRSAQVHTYDGLWLRLVDVDRALSARGYAAACDVVLDVVDEVCPWNHRRWRLTADDKGVATCTATADEADLRLPVAVLGGAYLGSRSVAAQAHHGLVEELRPGAVGELARAMRADREPVGAILF